MRFSEIVNLRYALTDTDVEELLEEIEELWPDSGDDADLARIPNLTTKSKAIPVEREARAT
jgi:hypothetical protein